MLGLLAFVVFSVLLVIVGVGELAVPGGVLLVLTTYSALLRNTFYALGRLEFEAIAILGEIGIQAAGIIAGARLGADTPFFVWVYATSAAATALYSGIVIRAFGLAGIRLAFDLSFLWGWLRTALPFACLLVLLYGGMALATAQRNEKLNTAIAQALHGEGRYVAAASGQAERTSC